MALLTAFLWVSAATGAAAAPVDWRARGTAAVRAGDPEAALAAFSRAAAVQPDDAVLWNNVAVILWRLGNSDVARMAVDEALSLRTPYSEAIANQHYFAANAPPRGATGEPSGEVRFLQALLMRRQLARATASAPSVAGTKAPQGRATRSEPGPPLDIETLDSERPAQIMARPIERVVERLAPARPDITALLPPPISTAGLQRPAPSALQPVAEGGGKAPGDAMVAAIDVAALDDDSSAPIPAALVHLAAGGPDVLVVDKQAHRLYHYRNTAEGPRRVADYSCVVGKAIGRKRRSGDLRTPEGVYFLEERLTDAELAPRYGVLAYPTDYPNSFDRLAGRRGNGIWLHGTDEPERLALRDDSRGCVVLANEDLLALSRAIRPGRTPVVVVAAVQWVAPEVAMGRSNRIQEWLDGWRQEWERGDLAAYRTRYGQEFFRLARTRPSTWLRRKQKLLAEERHRRIELARVTILRSGEQLVVVCDQTYRSPRHSDTGTKRIYLAADGPGYHIVDEKWLPAG